MGAWQPWNFEILCKRTFEKHSLVNLLLNGRGTRGFEFLIGNSFRSKASETKFEFYLWDCFNPWVENLSVLLRVSLCTNRLLVTVLSKKMCFMFKIHEFLAGRWPWWEIHNMYFISSQWHSTLSFELLTICELTVIWCDSFHIFEGQVLKLPAKFANLNLSKIF